MSESRTEDRLSRLEEDIRDIKAMLAQLMPMVVRIDATLPHLATKAEVTTVLSDLRIEMNTGLTELRTEIGTLGNAIAHKPSRGEMWAMMGAMTGAFAVILTALTFLQFWLKG
jgi:hypothetical protein